MDWFSFYQFASVNLTTENYDHSNHFVRIVSHHFTMDKANKDAPLFPQMVISTKKAAPLLPHVPQEGVSIPLMLATILEEEPIFNKKYLGRMSYSN